MKSKRHPFLAAFAGLLALVSAALGQTAPPSFLDSRVIGHGSPALIFIPGLATPGIVWKDTAAAFQATHACHLITLAGFGGKAPVKTDHFLDEAADQIIAYARAQKLEHPIIVGHSLGGVLALKIALKAPELPGRLIIVDSLPFLAGLMDPAIATAADAKPMADGFRQSLSASTPEQFAAGQKKFIASMVTAPENAAAVAALTSKSDPATTGQAMGELLTDDLRASLGGVRCPVLVLGALAGAVAEGAPREMVEAGYRKQYAGLPQARFVWFDKARHFIMVDDPAGFNAALTKELAEK